MAGDYSHPARRRRRVMLPATLFLATCASTFWAGATDFNPVEYMRSFEAAGLAIFRHWRPGLLYMAAVLAILLTHEMGHFVTTLRYRIPASLPFFIPMPVAPFGTLGAVIGMEGSRADRRQMFDQGLAGPLAGLVVALPVTWIGIHQLPAQPVAGSGICFYSPLIFQLMIDFFRPDYPTGSLLYLNQFNPFLMAGYVGMLITGLNMLPIGQLDGGHVSYALFGRGAHVLARMLLIGAILFVLIYEKWLWVLMIVIVTLIGTDHPPTADDRAPLGPLRRILGLASLTIPVFCFHPFVIKEFFP